MGSGNDILDMYIYETNTLLEQLESIVLGAEKEETFSEDNVNEIFRIMHTIKGSSAMMEFDTLATVSHRIEDLFFIIRENSMSVVSKDNLSTLFDLVFQSIDYFRGEVAKIESDEPLSKNIDSFMSNINSLISKIKGEPAQEEAAAAPQTSCEAAAPEEAPLGGAEIQREGNKDFPYEIIVYFDEGCGMENLRAFMLVTSIKDFCSEGDFIFEPDDVETNNAAADQVIESGFRIMFRNAEDRNNAIPVVSSAGSVRLYQAHDFQFEETVVKEEAPKKEETKVEKIAAAEEKSAAKAPAPAVQHPKESLISVNLSKLEQLSAVVGEIVITESMVTSSPDLKGLELDAFTKSARQLRKLTDELQDVSMSLRMVPISGTFQKMNRIVRDMCKKLNKRAKLVLVGEDTEVDKTIVDNIGDPIMHIVRNSMDHGIEESEEDRIARGKDPVGQITLSAKDTGNEVIIEVIDDGRGVDYESVLNKAINNGIAYPDVEYSNKEIINFLMMPGFSTN
ncbi:MAG: Hpt domain-containing protein, partial [Firmicutes bacterium]|nr:Hpt domain-containing protein [Bacillota bacterium]